LTAVTLAVLAIPGPDATGAANRPASRVGTTVKTAPTLHNRCKRSRIDVPACGVLWGMYLTPTPAKPQWAGAYPSIERKIGRRFDIVKRYVDWEPGITFPDGSDAKLAAGGRVLDFSWNAVNYRTHGLISWASIASGRWDSSVIVPEARRLKSFHHKVFLDFDHEFDSAKFARAGSMAQFVEAYRHIHNVLRRAGVHNVIWTWVATGFTGNEAKIKAGYPGSSYVDWVGYDPYNFSSCQKASWQSSMRTIAPYYRWLRRQPGIRDKPILLGEYASLAGSRVESWYASISRTLRRLPRIKAVMQWSARASSVCDFRLTNSARAMRGFRAASHSRYILGRG
jgi:Glycosyl hydrolase family 26